MGGTVLAAGALLLAVLVLCCAVLTVYRARRQVGEMLEALEDVKQGNGNRRLLAETHDLTAPLAYTINEIVQGYEGRLVELYQAEETNKQLMTSLSHDVRTPLTTLIGYLDAVHREIVTGEEREAYITTARRKAYDLKEYIDLLFDWFKLNSNEFTLHPLRMELAETTRNLLIDWIPVLEDKKIAYAVDLPERPFWVALDVDGYGRILNNLIQNVVTHSQAEELRLELKEEDETVTLTLSDNGVDMEKDDLHRIFDRLYQCDKSRGAKGSGLGLSIVKQLTEKMGGAISAESTAGEGTAFTLRFPKSP